MQTLLRQLAESKDSLQFSNHLCEQLELKVEELEASNEQLTRFCRERQALLDQKSSSLARIEDDLVTARDECDHVRADLEHLRGSGTEEGKGGSGRGNEREGGGDCDGQQMEEEVSRLREEVDTLTLRVQSAEFQKRRFKREMTNALRENANLSRNLEKAEAELAELHLGVEEICDENPVTPHDPACHMTQLVAPPDPSLPTPTTQNGSTTSPDDSQLSRSEDHHRSGDSNSQSLFSELDTQFSSLQTSYGDLLNRCTCLASLELKKQQGVDVGGEGVGPSSTDRDEGRRVGGAFKELFDEMFATLRQTAEVADRLIEKRVTSSP